MSPELRALVRAARDYRTLREYVDTDRGGLLRVDAIPLELGGAFRVTLLVQGKHRRDKRARLVVATVKSARLIDQLEGLQRVLEDAEARWCRHAILHLMDEIAERQPPR